MKNEYHDEKKYLLPWFMQRWFWVLLGIVLVVGVFLLIELILPVYTLDIGWEAWSKSKEFKTFIGFRVLIGALIFGVLVYPKVKKTYISKRNYG